MKPQLIKTLLIDRKQSTLDRLSSTLEKYFPELNISTNSISSPDSFQFLAEVNPKLLFIGSDYILENASSFLNVCSTYQIETIVTFDASHQIAKVLNYNTSGLIIKPLSQENIISTANKALNKIRQKEELNDYRKLLTSLQKLPSNEIVGIPTIEGIEFIPIQDIIRFEGLRRYTRIITNEKSDIISSYNIGEFIKKLECHGFFSPHKSHLINLFFVRKYHKEGSITLVDGSTIPVSKRRKVPFLQAIKSL